MTIVRKYTASDGTQLVVYQDNTGYQNTVPQKVFNKLIKNSNGKSIRITPAITTGSA